MIRYSFNAAQVAADIGQLDSNWLKKAGRRTAKLLRHGSYHEKTSIWSTVKPVYMTLQHNKCVFCERQLEGGDAGRIEHDLEHFRPKSSVEAWPPARGHALIYSHPTGSDFPTGYYWLAYDLHNYAVACKVCNSSYKHVYFPVGGARVQPPGPATAAPAVAALLAEQPLLCYPLGSSDDDPEDLITFRATTAVPVHAAGFLRRRAEVMIDFFGLNAREQLHKERARWICIFGAQLQRRHQGIANGNDLKLIAKLSEPYLPHASCLRAYGRLWRDDPALAARIYDVCRDYAVSPPNTRPPVV